MKVFEFKQIESGSNFRIEIDYHHYMQKQTAWLDGDILEMGEKPLELVNARLYVDDELKYSSNVVSGYDLKLSEDIRTIKGYKVRTVHALKLAIINPEVWEKYEDWLEEVIKDGTEPEVKEFQKREKEKAAAEELEYAKEVVRIAESQKESVIIRWKIQFMSQKIWICSLRKVRIIANESYDRKRVFSTERTC